MTVVTDSAVDADGFTDEQRAFREATRGFVQRLAPPERIREFETAGEIPRDVWAAFAAQGLLGVGTRVQDGGSGGDAVELALLVWELSRASMSLAMRYLASAYSGVHTLIGHGTDAQRETYLGPYFRGETEFGFAFTEPSGGADVRGWTSHAKRMDGGWRLNGSKMFTSNADKATVLLVVVRTDAGAGTHQGFTMFLVDPRAPGVSVTRVETLGLRAEGTFEVHFDDVLLDEDAIVGEAGRGFYGVLSSLDMERILVASVALGNAEAALEDAIGYAQQREAFGRPIGALQAVQHQLADSACDLELARLITFKAARLHDSGGDCSQAAVMAKYTASENAFSIVHRGMRVLGGYGFTTEMPMERRFRDAQLLLTGPISSEMSRNFIGERLGLPKSY